MGGATASSSDGIWSLRDSLRSLLHHIYSEAPFYFLTDTNESDQEIDRVVYGLVNITKSTPQEDNNNILSFLHRSIG
jgi:hypothetical protein